MKNTHLLLLPVVMLFAFAAVAQTTSEAPKTPAPAQDLAATPPTQSPSTPRVELFPTPEVPPAEVQKDPASTQDVTAMPPSQPSSTSHTELFPIMEVPAAEAPSSSVPAQDLGAAEPGESSSASHVELFSMPEVPAEEAVEAPAPLSPAEIELQTQIQNAISKDPTLSGDNVSVSLSASGIELSGTVATVRGRLAASRLAKSYAANRKVVDKITIAARHETPAEPPKADTPGTARQNP